MYLRAASLHFRLSAVFDSPDSPDYQSHLFFLWQSTYSFLECVFDLDKTGGSLLLYATNYILQIVVAAGFARPCSAPRHPSLLEALSSSPFHSVKPTRCRVCCLGQILGFISSPQMYISEKALLSRAITLYRRLLYTIVRIISRNTPFQYIQRTGIYKGC